MNEIVEINPKLDSALITVLFDLERLRYQDLEGTTPPWLFFDLKEVMHLLESIASARIEGNHTTIAGAANDIIENEKPTNNESLKELRNIRKGIEFIEQSFEKNVPISEGFIREMHKIVVSGLKKDGSKTPGKFRTENVTIQNSSHIPPEHPAVPGLVQELVEYATEPSSSKLDIIKIAIAHHRFTAIHPFDNGNGRTARLLTYAMLAKAGFIDDHGFRLLNPASIFCIDRKEYFRQLSNADKGTLAGVEKWCLYVAKGIQQELERVDKLLDRKFAVEKIISPALKAAAADKIITDVEYEILKIAIEKNIFFQARDVKHLFGTTQSAAVQTSRMLASMKSKQLIMSVPKRPNKYVMRFASNHLLRYVLDQMGKNQLLPLANVPEN